MNTWTKVGWQLLLRTRNYTSPQLHFSGSNSSPVCLLACPLAPLPRNRLRERSFHLLNVPLDSRARTHFGVAKTRRRLINPVLLRDRRQSLPSRDRSGGAVVEINRARRGLGSGVAGLDVVPRTSFPERLSGRHARTNAADAAAALSGYTGKDFRAMA